MNNDEYNMDDDEVQIVDLDPIESDGKVRPEPPRPKPHLRLWLRWSLALLIIASCLGLLFFTWPDASSVFGNKHNQSATPTTGPGRAESQTNSVLLPVNGITYIATFTYPEFVYSNAGGSSTYRGTAEGPGTLDAVRESNGKHIWHYHNALIADPFAANGIVYIPSTNGIDAIRARDQKLLWHSSQKASILKVENGMLYTILLTDGSLDALRASDGHVLWHDNQHVNPTFPQPVDNGIIYALSGQDTSRIDALRASDGHMLWQYQLSVSNSSIIVESLNGIVCMIGNGSLDVLRAQDGVRLWHKDGIQGIQFENNAILYVATVDKGFAALNANTGDMIWNNNQLAPQAYYIMGTPRGGNNELSTPVWNVPALQLQNGIIYAETTSSNTVVALRADTGALVWQYNQNIQAQIILIQNGVICAKAITQDGSNVIVGLHASDGSQLWQQKEDQQINTISALYSKNNEAYISSTRSGDTRETISTIHLDNGKPSWQYNADPSTFINLVWNGIIYIDSPETGIITALNINNGHRLWSYRTGTA